MNHKKIGKMFKVYNLYMNCIWKMLGTIVLGGGIGYWIQTKNPDSKAVAYGVIIGILVATPIFFIELHRLSVRLEKEESIKKEKDKENEETEG